MTDIEQALRSVPWITNTPKHGFNQCDRSSYECPDHMTPDYPALATVVQGMIEKAVSDSDAELAEMFWEARKRDHPAGLGYEDWLHCPTCAALRAAPGAGNEMTTTPLDNAPDR